MRERRERLSGGVRAPVDRRDAPYDETDADHSDNGKDCRYAEGNGEVAGAIHNHPGHERRAHPGHITEAVLNSHPSPARMGSRESLGRGKESRGPDADADAAPGQCQ
jgi:hypothetical protein